MDVSIEQMMRQLKLGGLAKDWQSIEYKTTEQYVRDLLTLELLEREANRITKQTKLAGFRVIKTLKAFIWKPGIELPGSITRDEIEEGAFIERRENLVLVGSNGTGKTHLATAIAYDQCKRGKKVKFFTATSLANLLHDKQDSGGLAKYLTTLSKLDLIVIDELGFITLHKDSAELLFQVVSDAYERKSLIITSNLEFSQWNSVFGDAKLTAALIDRLIHHSHIVVFSGQGHRMEEAMSRGRKAGG
jgi:DNA replication protein DnaC